MLYLAQLVYTNSMKDEVREMTKTEMIKNEIRKNFREHCKAYGKKYCYRTEAFLIANSVKLKKAMRDHDAGIIN